MCENDKLIECITEKGRQENLDTWKYQEIAGSKKNMEILFDCCSLFIDKMCREENSSLSKFSLEFKMMLRNQETVSDCYDAIFGQFLGRLRESDWLEDFISESDCSPEIETFDDYFKGILLFVLLADSLGEEIVLDAR